ncbi:MAG: IseA DL-endopeptidase inhibitor family protein, partial [Muribaculaceae bacterium]|nr:IseA DL-endopeptidase inhibitor family protein [Muribaculaceae bacterium]
IELYDTVGVENAETDADYTTADGAEYVDYGSETAVLNAEKEDLKFFKELDYIPESYLYQTEPLKFMPEPKVSEDGTGRLTAEVITYTLNPEDMTMRRAYEPVSDGNIYYGYMTHAVAGEIYKYFIATSLNVSDNENFKEVKLEGEEQSRYFFKVDDPRFGTVKELRDYVSEYFSEELTDYMFANAPQKYRDIDGELYTVLGDGGYDETLGKLTITDFVRQENTIVYHTKQEKFNENHEMSYIDGGDFVIEMRGDGTVIVTKYRYPNN